MSGPKIVRKVQANQVGIAFWLDGNSEIRAVYESTERVAEESRAMGLGWEPDEWDAELVGTTLAALRAELEGGDK